jgi:hypothetical protein
MAAASRSGKSGFRLRRSVGMNEQILLNYAARLALQEAAKIDAAKVVDFAERRDEFERRRRKRAERKMRRGRLL